MGAEKKVRRKKFFTITDKVWILRRIEAGEKNVDIARAMNITHSAASYMLRHKDQIRKQYQTLLETQGDTSITKLSGVVESPVEKSVFMWYKHQRKRRL